MSDFSKKSQDIDSIIGDIDNKKNEFDYEARVLKKNERKEVTY